MTTNSSVLNIQNTKPRGKRRYPEKERAVFQHRKSLAIHLDPLVEDSLCLLPGLDVCRQELRGNELVVKFYRKSSEQPTPATSEYACKYCESEAKDIPIGELIPSETGQWIEYAKHQRHLESGKVA